MSVRPTQNLVTGALFVLLGGFAMLYGARYPMGSALRMGPGYFPFIISIALILVGTVLVIGDIRLPSDLIVRFEWRPLTSILGATLAFGLLIETAGLVVAGLTLVVLSRLAADRFRPLETGILAVSLVGFTAVLFSSVLGLPLRILPF